MFRWFGAAGLILVSAPFASADPVTSYSGNDLYGMCIAAPFGAQEYALGAAEGSAYLGKIGTLSSPVFCVPLNVDISQYGDVICHYLAGHPAVRQYPASALVTAAFADAWPCHAE